MTIPTTYTIYLARNGNYTTKRPKSGQSILVLILSDLIKGQIFHCHSIAFISMHRHYKLCLSSVRAFWILNTHRACFTPRPPRCKTCFASNTTPLLEGRQVVKRCCGRVVKPAGRVFKIQKAETEEDTTTSICGKGIAARP